MAFASASPTERVASARALPNSRSSKALPPRHGFKVRPLRFGSEEPPVARRFRLRLYRVTRSFGRLLGRIALSVRRPTDLGVEFPVATLSQELGRFGFLKDDLTTRLSIGERFGLLGPSLRARNLLEHGLLLEARRFRGLEDQLLSKSLLLTSFSLCLRLGDLGVAANLGGSFTTEILDVLLGVGDGLNGENVDSQPGALQVPVCHLLNPSRKHFSVADELADGQLTDDCSKRTLHDVTDDLGDAGLTVEEPLSRLPDRILVVCDLDIDDALHGHRHTLSGNCAAEADRYRLDLEGNTLCHIDERIDDRAASDNHPGPASGSTRAGDDQRLVRFGYLVSACGKRDQRDSDHDQARNYDGNLSHDSPDLLGTPRLRRFLTP